MHSFVQVSKDEQYGFTVILLQHKLMKLNISKLIIRSHDTCKRGYVVYPGNQGCKRCNERWRIPKGTVSWLSFFVSYIPDFLDMWCFWEQVVIRCCNLLKKINVNSSLLVTYDKNAVFLYKTLRIFSDKRIN
jgi:hypothetical protein